MPSHLLHPGIADGHWGCFLLSAIVNSAAVNVAVPASLWDTDFHSSRYVSLGLTSLSHTVAPFSMFWGTLFSVMTAAVYTYTNSAPGFPFLHMLTDICSLSLFFFLNKSHPNRGKVIFQCGFHLHFPYAEWCWTPLYMPVGHSYVFFGKMSIEVLCPLFNWVTFSFAVKLDESFIYGGYWFLIRYMAGEYFLPFCRLPLQCLGCFLCLCRAR